MFTGLIEEIGIIKGITKGSKSITLTIGAAKVLENIKLGDSIATNGVCLTVTHYNTNMFTADVMPETMRMTSLGNLVVGGLVNLERALRLGDRLGGHLLSGHIDCVGTIESFQKEDNATWITIRPPASFMPYVLHKGSVAIDGVSLTVAALERDVFKVSIIPMTKDETTLLKKKVGAIVNLEGDMIGKYVERFMTFGVLPSSSAISEESSEHKEKESDAAKKYAASMSLLRENGFL